MLRRLQPILAAAVFMSSLYAQEIGLRVTAFDEKTGDSIAGLSAEHFTVTDGGEALRVESARPAEGPLDVLLLVDAGLLGEMVKPFAPAFADLIADGERMAVVSYHDSADLAQDFTSNRQLLRKAIANIRYGNAPRIVDALFASIDGGFESSAERKAVILLSAGVEGRSRSSQSEVLSLAREKGVSVYSVFVDATDRGLFKTVAMRSGGAYFHTKKLKHDPQALAERVFSALRGQYELTLSGASLLFGRVEVKVKSKSKRKITASALVLE